MENFRMELPGSPEHAELNAMECCALHTAFVKNPDTAAGLEGVVSGRELQILADEVKRTDHLMFPPNPLISTVYFQMATAELQRLEHEQGGLSCGHSVENHRKALRAVESRFAQPIN